MLGEVETPTLETTYTVIDNGTQKGKRKLGDSDGYSYTVKVCLFMHLCILIYLNDNILI